MDPIRAVSPDPSHPRRFPVPLGSHEATETAKRKWSPNPWGISPRPFAAHRLLLTTEPAGDAEVFARGFAFLVNRSRSILLRSGGNQSTKRRLR